MKQPSRTILLVQAILVVTFAIPALAAANGSDEVIPLGVSAAAHLQADGSWQIGMDTGRGWVNLVAFEWGAVIPGRTAPPVEVFRATSREGDVSGRRGFSPDADDDLDGHTDEDRLDGQDNDGDGRIDEDFAAIGHSMTVWNGVQGDQVRHLEAYHWSYPVLETMLAFDLTYTGPSTAALARFVLPNQASWLQVNEVCRHEGVLGSTGATGTQRAFLAAVGTHDETGQDLWFGVVALDTRGRSGSRERIRALGRELVIPLLDKHLALVVSLGASQLQVVQDLEAAVALHGGVTDPISERRIDWVPPVPATVSCGSGDAVEVVPYSPGGYLLRFVIGAGDGLLPDPDLLVADGRHLGRAARLTWSPVSGGSRSQIWPPMSAGDDPCHPYKVLGVDEPGVLEFEMVGPTPFSGATLAVVMVDGRRVECPLEFPAADPSKEAQAPRDQDGFDGHLRHLSPRLISNYPNPFRFDTRISYQVPATIGEAFDLEEFGELELGPDRLMPYRSDMPAVEVRVYSLKGRILTTLHTGRQTVGTYEVSWDGKDDQGKTLPSGAYFCTLQIENWSITKRLIFVR